MTKIGEITEFLEQIAPPSYQENYDNSRLLTGNKDSIVRGIITALDVTEEVVEEAISNNCNLIVAHHPIIFKGLKQLTGRNYVERVVIKAIKHDIAIYALHTNLDAVRQGVNFRLAEILALRDCHVLLPKKGIKKKLVVFVPAENTNALLVALQNAGAGVIGNYEGCSFRTFGTGTFIPNENAQPYLGEIYKLEEVQENRIEMIFPSHLENKILLAMRMNHPYEEVAYFIQNLENIESETGAGLIGNLEIPFTKSEFLQYLKEKLNLPIVRYTCYNEKPIQKIALCGGSGSFLLHSAVANGADAFITADFKYHEFFDAEDKILVADIGHYESEIHTKALICGIISKKFTNIAVRLTDVNTNPVSYYY
jgi:dinuclear metal center YbgI/SA1388 family protein